VYRLTSQKKFSSVHLI